MAIFTGIMIVVYLMSTLFYKADIATNVMHYPVTISVLLLILLCGYWVAVFLSRV